MDQLINLFRSSFWMVNLKKMFRTLLVLVVRIRSVSCSFLPHTRSIKKCVKSEMPSSFLLNEHSELDSFIHSIDSIPITLHWYFFHSTMYLRTTGTSTSTNSYSVPGEIPVGTTHNASIYFEFLHVLFSERIIKRDTIGLGFGLAFFPFMGSQRVVKFV